MKYLKLFEDYEHYYSKDESEVCSDCRCETCECDEKPNEFDFEEDEFDYEKDGVKYGKKYLNEPPAEIHIEGKKNGKKPKSQKEKELAKKYPPKDKITKGDFIAAAIENEKKGKKEEDKEKGKKEEKGLSAAQKKLPAGLQAAIARKAAKKNPKD